MKRYIRAIANKLGFDIVRLRHLNEDFSAHLTNVFSMYAIDCVIDVGANAGQYGMFLRKIGYGGWIVSFEPVEAVFAQLQEISRADTKWICFKAALGDSVQKKEMNVYSSTVFSSFLNVTPDSKEIWTSLEEKVTETVNVSMLDEIFPEIVSATGGSRFYLKMDTQGYDINVFRGARSTLRQVWALQSEVPLIPIYSEMPAAYDVLDEFHSAGYFISGMYPINRDKSLSVIEYDCVLVRRSRDNQ